MPRLATLFWLRARRLAVRLLTPPRTIRFTRDGVKFVAVTLAIGVAAINTGNNLLYLVLAMMLSFIILSGLLSELTMRGVALAREVAVTAVAGQPVSIRVGLTNTKRWAPTLSLAVHDVLEGGRRRRPAPGPAETSRVYFLKVSPGETVWGRYTHTFPRRGRVRFAGFRLVTRYPFGLFVKSGTVDGEGEIVVFPAVDPVGAPPPGESLTAGDRAVARRGAGSTPSGLREYRVGDEPRAVHWRRSAALDELVVRELDRDDRDRVCIALPAEFQAGAIEAPRFAERFEGAVRRAASLAVHFLERGYEVEVRAGATRVRLGTGTSQRRAVLTALALVEPRAGRPRRRGGLRPGAADGVPARPTPLPPPPEGMLAVLVTPDPSLHAGADLAAWRHVEGPAA